MRKLFFQLARSLGTWLRFCEAVQKSAWRRRVWIGNLSEPDRVPTGTNSEVIAVAAGVGAAKDGKMAPNFS